MRFNLFFTLSLIFVVSCSETNPYNDLEYINSKLVDVKIIGGNSDSIFFSNPEFIVVDSLGNFYVADRGHSKIFKFDRDFEFLKTIGSRGRGPNEFTDISGLIVNQNNNLVVFDKSQQLIKEFSTDGILVNTFDSPLITTNTLIRPYKDELIFVHLSSTIYEPKNYLIHTIGENFNTFKSHSFSSYDLHLLDDEISITGLLGRAASLAIEADTILLALKAYNGIIYKLVKEDSINGFQKLDEKKGLIYNIPIETISTNKLGSRYVDATLSQGGKKTGILFNNWSLGLFQLANGKWVHFTYVENKDNDKRIFGVEVFNKNLSFEAYSPLNEKVFTADIKTSRLLNMDIPLKDENDLFYIIEREREFPIIRISKLLF